MHIDYETAVQGLRPEPEFSRQLDTGIAEFKSGLTPLQRARYDALEDLFVQEQGILLRQLYDKLLKQ